MNSEIAAALNAISRALDGSPSPDTIYGVQIILECIASKMEA